MAFSLKSIQSEYKDKQVNQLTEVKLNDKDYTDIEDLKGASALKKVDLSSNKIVSFTGLANNVELR